MFPLQSGDELVFGSAHSISPPDKSLLDDLNLDHVFLGCMPTTMAAAATMAAAVKGERLIQFGNLQNKSEKIGGELNVKKVTRRDIERQRRHEMANLYASLRCLLPLEYMKGKRSISDHMQEAVNYIKHKQKNVQDLQMRRDKLKKSSNLSNNLTNHVKMNVEKNEVEILINVSVKNSGFGISKVFAELMERGLDVISWVSTKANETYLHQIQAEARDLACIDLSLLQERLIHLINYYGLHYEKI